MSAPPYQKLFWGSYHKHTAHLSHAREHGAYLLLIGALWNNDGRLPADDDTLAGYAKLTTKEWLAMKPKLMPLFRIVRGKLVQPRVTDDLAKYKSTSGKRKEAGKAGGLASRGTTTGNRQANASRLPTKPEPEPEPKEEKDAIASSVAESTPKPKGRTYSEAFEAAWKAYPHHKGRSSKPNAAAIWAKLPDDERSGLVAAIGRFSPNVAETCGGKGAPDMAVWLKDGKHLNWGVEAGVDTPSTATFNAPQVRASIVLATDEDFARSWVDHYCRWVPEGRRLEARTPAVAAMLTQKLAAWAKAKDVTIAVAAANDTPPLFAEGAAA